MRLNVRCVVTALVALIVSMPVVSLSASHKLGGVDFDELTYQHGPCNDYNARMHGGTYSVPQEDRVEADVMNVAGGSLGGNPVAIVTLRCDAHAVVETDEVRAFEVTGGQARQLAVLGRRVIEGGEGFYHGPYPDDWIFVSFSEGKLYADVWQFDHRCDPARDWTVTTYVLRNGTLARINALQHHRVGAPLPKATPKGSRDTCSY